MDNPSHDSAALLLYQLVRNQKAQQQRHENTSIAPEQRLLRRWQMERLKRTHADLLATPRYKPAVEFFLAELYGDKDFTERDQDIARAYPIIVRTMPAKALQSIAMALELNALSQELDTTLLQALLQNKEHLEVIDEASYITAYRQCNNYDLRVQQIDLINTLGRDLEKVVSNPWVYAALHLAHVPAYLAGFGRLQQFMEMGFHAFRQMGKADEFLTTIVQRERTLLDRIYHHHPAPFALDQP